jgi:CxxC-x17-CxxC domain-containing protein
MADKTIICKDCGASFVFSENEQAIFKERGFENEPQRCAECRALKKQQSRGMNRGGYDRAEREMFPAVCAQCGKSTTVPFKPSNEKPVYCKECYQSRSR